MNTAQPLDSIDEIGIAAGLNARTKNNDATGGNEATDTIEPEIEQYSGDSEPNRVESLSAIPDFKYASEPKKKIWEKWFDFRKDPEIFTEKFASWPELESDDIRLPPFQSICRLSIKYHEDKIKTYKATGFLLNPSLVVTSAHVIQHPDGLNAKEITVHPGYGAFINEQRSFSFKKCSEWGQSTGSIVPANDYGAILLEDSSLFANYWPLELVVSNTVKLKALVASGREFAISGYPVGSNLQVQTVGKLLDPRPNMFYHRVRAEWGHSGSPFFVVTKGPPITALVIGIHSKVAEDVSNAWAAARVTDRMRLEIREWNSLTLSGNIPLV